MSMPSRSFPWRPPGPPVTFESKKTPVKMSTPTSAPKSSTGKDKNPKLRASCNSCATSKVKCSKEHPTCARCLASSTECVYGVSRKHGKPGRTRKRNTDGTPFVKVVKQRLSPGGGEFSTFMLPSTLQRTDSEATSNWGSDWSPTPSGSTPSGLDSETVPTPSYADNIHSSTAYMDTTALWTPHAPSRPMPATGSDQLFQGLFTQEPTVQSDYPDWQHLNDYIGGNNVNPIEHHSGGARTIENLCSGSSISASYSPMSRTIGINDNVTPYPEIATDNSHCCYPLAYSTLESLRHIKHSYPVDTKDSFDAVLPTVRSVKETTLQLLRCSCSSDPHLAMLYSSMTFKILAWYRAAASASPGFKYSASASASSPWNYCQPLPFSQTVFSPSSASSIGEVRNHNMYIPSSPFTQYKIDDVEQQRHMRQIVLCELRSCGKLIEALANWRGNGEMCEQAEYLYNFLGGWLKSELYKIVKEIESKDFPVA